MGLGVGLLGIYGFFVEPLSREFGVGVATINIGPVALLLVPALVVILYAAIPENRVVGWTRVKWLSGGVSAAALYMLLLFPALSW